MAQPSKQAHNLYVMLSATGASPEEIRYTLKNIKPSVVKSIAEDILNLPYNSNEEAIDLISFNLK